MESLPLLLGGGMLAAAVVLYVLLPVVQGKAAPLERTDEDVSEEEHRRETSLRALRDLEYDRLTGKVDRDDYRSLKADLAREALAALDAGEDAEDAGAADVALPADPPASHRETEEAVEAEIAKIRRGLRDGRTCRMCAHVNRAGARYCAQCGRPLEREERKRVAAGSDGG